MTRNKKIIIINLVLYLVLLVLFTLLVLFGNEGYLKVRTDTDFLVFKYYYLALLVSSILIGGSLGMSSAILQVFFRNPLADTNMLGISSGSQFFGIIILLLSDSYGFFSYSFILFLFSCILGAILVLLLFLTLVCKKNMVFSMSSIVLIGISLSSIFSSMSNFLISFNNDNFLLQQVLSWQLGSSLEVTWSQIIIFLFILILFLSFILTNSHIFDMFSLGEAEAKLMGVNIRSFFIRLMFFLSLLIASTVAISGPISFVGFISPHISRILTKTNKTFSIAITSFAFGALIMLTSEAFSIKVIYPNILPLSIITSVIGSPFLIFVIFKYLKNSN